jgi:hypothetical protein
VSRLTYVRMGGSLSPSVVLPESAGLPSVSPVLRIVCGGCGAEVVVHRDVAGGHTRCAACGQRVRVQRMATQMCPKCGNATQVDLAGGSTVAICDHCARPLRVAIAVAPVAHQRPHKVVAPRRKRTPGPNGVGLILMGAVMFLSVLLLLLLVFS